MNLLYLHHWAFYLGLTPLYQNYIIKKHNLFYVLDEL